MRSVIPAVIVSAVAFTPAHAADQFDLICRAKGSEVHYRIDLAAGVWCGGQCTAVEKIASVTSGMLTLQDIKPAYRGDLEAHITVNRVTGEWEQFNFSAAIELTPFVDRGQCEPARYSGMPTPKF